MEQLNNSKWKTLVIFIILSILSCLLGICTIVLTVIPFESSLVKLLLEYKRLMVLNIWPIFCVMSLGYFCTNRIWGGFLISGILSFALAEANRFKMVFRDDPLVFSDIFLIGEAREMSGKYELFLDKESLCVLIFILLMLVICIWGIKLKIANWKWRVAGTLLTVVLFTILCNPLYFQNVHHDDMWNDKFGNYWKNGNHYMSRGVVYSFIHSIPDSIITPPDGYNVKEETEILEKYQTVDLEEEKKVHIISIMLEAYNDFSTFEEIDFLKDPYENMHKIQQQAYHGDLFTNIFAAGTVDTERAFLTGYSETSFKQKNTESYVRYLKSQGYYTEAMHPCYGWFYNRKNINLYLGFDNFEYYENAYSMVDEDALEMETYHDLLSDYDFFDYIIESFEESVNRGEKYFNFSVTYQNHGPYPITKEYEEEYVTRKESYTDEEYNIFNNYLYGIEKTDMALEKLYSYISQSDEPIVLILFGDHNPWLGENNSVYEMLGINLDLDMIEGGKNYYQTPYVFYANDVAKKQLNREFNELGNTISPMFLMNELFAYIGTEGPEYLNYLYDVKEEFSVINPVYVKKKDQYILRTELLETDVEKLNEMNRVAYYMKNRKIQVEK